MAAWLRLYAEMVDDPKVGALSDSEFRTWIGLLCLACKAEAEGDTLHTIQQANWALRRDINADLPHLLSLSLIVASPIQTLTITNWSKRQYVSDSSRERVQKHRALQKRPGNALDKSREDKNRADTEQSGAFAQFWNAYPKKVGKGQAERAWKALDPDASLLTQILTAIEAQKADRLAAVKAGAFRPEWKNPSTWLNAQAWLDEIQPIEPPARKRGDPAPHITRPLSDADRERAAAALKREEERKAALSAPVDPAAQAKVAGFVESLAKSKAMPR